MILYAENAKNYRLKLITQDDIEELRIWKNRNKNFFFLKKDITSGQQYKWFNKYNQNKEDFMFVVQEVYQNKYINIGCMGFRILEEEVDVYNIMRGISIDNSKYSMSLAFTIMNSFIFNTYKFDIKCRVLIDNPAKNWYEKLYYEEEYEENGFVLYKLNTNKLKKINFKKENI